MKRVALLFSFIIFFQSLSICAPELYKHAKNHQIGEVKMSCSDIEGLTKQHNCCHDKSKSSNNDEKDDCCGDGCKCFCCIKVFVQNCFEKTGFTYETVLIVKSNIKPLFCHSFDFHQSFIAPPRA